MEGCSNTTSHCASRPNTTTDLPSATAGSSTPPRITLSENLPPLPLTPWTRSM